MKDADCTAFLQWALPQMRMRWRGFRKVRRQVCRRISRRMQELGTTDYRAWLEDHPDEWTVLDGLCRITISRFYRDKGIFDTLLHEVLPSLIDNPVHIWCAGCASGEEPYTVRLLWDLGLSPENGQLSIVATDSDPKMLERARRGVYPAGNLKDLPAEWMQKAFEPQGDEFRLKDRHKDVEFLVQDVRHETPQGPFDIVLCRNLVFTYYDESLQAEIQQRILRTIRPGGYMVTGKHEKPATDGDVEPVPGEEGIYRLVH
jgi:chemotaxis protein methyltransferase CheR